MYTPSYHLMIDRTEIFAFMKQYNFGVIVTTKDNEITATHLPFVVSEEGNSIVLYAHCAKANKQWKEMKENKVLVIFNEPHAYVSPSLYEHNVNVPTWNYAAVHAYGNVELIEDREGIIEILERSFNFFEPAYVDQWKTLPDDYRNGLLNGVVAFKINVTDLQGKKKLSQNRSENERQNIIESFSKSASHNEREIAKLMESLDI
ncbi:MAG TPA: FMN-binding negative transcriptional regulator [Bacteroidia bacterium]|nr:FMN-binding negative transcriptional regulator [Bacteroidia bacterium]